jgi:hypothetical protein
MTQLYAVLAGALLLVGAFFYGKHVQAGQDAALTMKATIKADAAVARGDALTQARDLAAATHVQAMRASGDALRTAIAHTTFIPPAAEDAHADTKSDTVLCSDPFADPDFRMFYDAGSRAGAAPAETPDLSLAGARKSAAPAGRIRDGSAGG